MLIKKLTPYDDRVCLIRDKAREKIGSLYVPDTVKGSNKSKEQLCTILSVGINATQFKQGDRVVIAMNTGTEVLIDNEECILIRESDILIKLDND